MGFNFFQGHMHSHNFSDSGLDGKKCWLDDHVSSAQATKAQPLQGHSYLDQSAPSKILVLDDAIANICR